MKYVYFNWYGNIVRLKNEDAINLLETFKKENNYDLNNYKSSKYLKYKVDNYGDIKGSKKYLYTINIIQLEDMETIDRIENINIYLENLK